MSGNGLEALPDVREWSGDPSECPGVVERHFRMSAMPSWISGCGREAIPVVQEWSAYPPGLPRVVGRPSLMSESGR